MIILINRLFTIYLSTFVLAWLVFINVYNIMYTSIVYMLSQRLVGSCFYWRGNGESMPIAD